MSRGKQETSSGFTLTELLMSLAISSIVLTMAMKVLLYLSGSLAGLEVGSLAGDETALLVEYLTDKLMCAGGGSIRPWAAVGVEDDWQGNGSDRLTVAELADPSWQCAIVRLQDDLVEVDQVEGCCLSDAFAGRQVLLSSGPGDNRAHWRTGRVEEVALSNCTARLTLGVAAALEHPPSSNGAWVDGTLAVVNIKSLWLNTDTGELKLEEDRDHDGVLEVSTVADRVFDLQAALGYDVSPWDWHVTDTGGPDDEWLYNAPGERFQDPQTPGLESARRDELRLIRVGVVVGAPVSTRTGQGAAKILNGPLRTRSGWILRSFVGTTSLRNHDVMR